MELLPGYGYILLGEKSVELGEGFFGFVFANSCQESHIPVMQALEEKGDGGNKASYMPSAGRENIAENPE